jgi:hypothetical protein
MRVLLITLSTLLLLQLGGCAATSKPKTAAEYRQIPDVMAKLESFEVDRSYKDVASTFKKHAPKCLDVTIQRVSTMNNETVIANWNPTLIVGNDKAELYLQRVRQNGTIDISEMPVKGYFVLVVDAIPLSAKKTRIDVYKPAKGADGVVNAIKSWVNGGNETSCPDMTRADREIKTSG